MKKRFNVTGICYPHKHYMVNLDSRLAKIKELVDYGDYFVINRARQYGKTTTLWALNQYLQEEYTVLFISFQKLTASCFENEYAFVKNFVRLILDVVRNKRKSVNGLEEQILQKLERESETMKLGMMELFHHLTMLCETASKPVVLMIDEVDCASNNQVFLDFLGQLRSCYLDREMSATFQSVILAGVYDIKNLKHKIRPEDEHQYNSPWNIAADFTLDMSFSVEDIAGMLEEYENEHQTGMQMQTVASQIYAYTAGYPFLVSRMCMLLDETSRVDAWSEQAITRAVKDILREQNTLFDDMQKKMEDYPELKSMLRSILFNGKVYPYNIDTKMMQLATMFGYIKDDNGKVAITNRLFETRLYNQFISEEVMGNVTYENAVYNQNQFVQDGSLNMELVLQKFVEHFTDVYGNSTEKFVEENGRKLFLLYIKPIINGTGNYYVEARTRDMRRTDVIIDYLGTQYVIELKIWRGTEYNKRGEQQLAEYLESYHLKKGYMLSFNFNQSKNVGVSEIRLGDKLLVEAVV